jgi:universal stress protein A
VTTEARPASEAAIFDRILCGVDGTPASMLAVRQALRLQSESGELLLTAVANFAQAAHAGIAAGHATELLRQETDEALAEAKVIAPSARSRIADGDPATVLLNEAEAERVTLIAVGSHERRRAAGLMLGTVAARMLRDAPCSVLISRPARDADVWPQAVVVGVDGSGESAAAFAVARSVAARFGGSVRALASTKDELDLDAAQAIAGELDERADGAVDVLAAASESADLVVVGHRGLHGLKALGSVSERIAHRAHSSVLVVRAAHA